MEPEEFDKVLDESSLGSPHVRAVVEAGPPEPPPPKCWTCMDYGNVEVCHHSTDGLLRWDPCPALDDPVLHPPAMPVPLQTVTVPGHHPDCDGNCNYAYPGGCPPF